jgi:hypothetical protein
MGSRAAAVNWRPDREGKLCCSQGAHFIAPFSTTARKSRGIPVCSVGPAVTRRIHGGVHPSWSPTLVVPGFVHRLASRGGRGCRITGGSINRPVGLVKPLVEIFEEVLKEVDPHGVFNIDVAIVFKYEACDVRNDELVLFLTTTMFEVSCHSKSYQGLIGQFQR